MSGKLVDPILVRGRGGDSMLILEGRGASIYSLAFSPDGALLAAGSRVGSILLWDDHGRRFDTVPDESNEEGPINSLSFSPDGNSLAYGTSKGWVLADIGKLLGERNAKEQRFTGNSVTEVRHVSPVRLAVGFGSRAKAERGGFELWDTAEKRRLEPHFPSPTGVRAVAVLPEKKMVAWSAGRAIMETVPKLTVWSFTQPDAIHFKFTHDCPSLAIHPDGTHLIAAVDWKIKWFDLVDRREKRTLTGHKGIVSCLAFSPDGRVSASGSWDGTVRFWDSSTGSESACWHWPIGKVFSLAFSPDGLRVAAGGDKGNVVVWDIG